MSAEITREPKLRLQTVAISSEHATRADEAAMEIPATRTRSKRQTPSDGEADPAKRLPPPRRKDRRTSKTSATVRGAFPAHAPSSMSRKSPPHKMRTRNSGRLHSETMEFLVLMDGTRNASSWWLKATMSYKVSEYNG